MVDHRGRIRARQISIVNSRCRLHSPLYRNTRTVSTSSHSSAEDYEPRTGRSRSPSRSPRSKRQLFFGEDFTENEACPTKEEFHPEVVKPTADFNRTGTPTTTASLSDDHALVESDVETNTSSVGGNPWEHHASGRTSRAHSSQHSVNSGSPYNKNARVIFPNTSYPAALAVSGAMSDALSRMKLRKQEMEMTNVVDKVQKQMAAMENVLKELQLEHHLKCTLLQKQLDITTRLEEDNISLRNKLEEITAQLLSEKANREDEISRNVNHLSVSMQSFMKQSEHTQYLVSDQLKTLVNAESDNSVSELLSELKSQLSTYQEQVMEIKQVAELKVSEPSPTLRRSHTVNPEVEKPLASPVRTPEVKSRALTNVAKPQTSKTSRSMMVGAAFFASGLIVGAVINPTSYAAPAVQQAVSPLELETSADSGLKTTASNEVHPIAHDDDSSRITSSANTNGFSKSDSTPLKQTLIVEVYPSGEIVQPELSNQTVADVSVNTRIPSLAVPMLVKSSAVTLSDSTLGSIASALKSILDPSETTEVNEDDVSEFVEHTDDNVSVQVDEVLESTIEDDIRAEVIESMEDDEVTQFDEQQPSDIEILSSEIPHVDVVDVGDDSVMLTHVWGVQNELMYEEVYKNMTTDVEFESSVLSTEFPTPAVLQRILDLPRCLASNGTADVGFTVNPFYVKPAPSSNFVDSTNEFAEIALEDGLDFFSHPTSHPEPLNKSSVQSSISSFTEDVEIEDESAEQPVAPLEDAQVATVAYATPVHVATDVSEDVESLIIPSFISEILPSPTTELSSVFTLEEILHEPIEEFVLDNSTVNFDNFLESSTDETTPFEETQHENTLDLSIEDALLVETDPVVENDAVFNVDPIVPEDYAAEVIDFDMEQTDAASTSEMDSIVNVEESLPVHEFPQLNEVEIVSTSPEDLFTEESVADEVVVESMHVDAIESTHVNDGDIHITEESNDVIHFDVAFSEESNDVIESSKDFHVSTDHIIDESQCKLIESSYEINMVYQNEKKIRQNKVLASAKALGIHVGEDINYALLSHNTPHDQVFDKNINSTARLFLKNIAKHKAIPKNIKNKISISYGQKCILIIDSDRLRRDQFTSEMSLSFKVIIATSKKDAIQIIHMMNVHIALVRIRYNKDDAISFIQDCCEKLLTLPIVVIVSTTIGYENEIAQCIEAGACGYVQDDLPLEIIRYRLLDMTKTFECVDEEWRQIQPKPVDRMDQRNKRGNKPSLPHKFSARTVVTNGFRRSSKIEQLDPNIPIGYDTSPSMNAALDSKIQHRQNFIQKQQQVHEIMTIKHSVLGLGSNTFKSQLKQELIWHESPIPSNEETSEYMYTQPHTVATLVQRHDYDVIMKPARDAMPEDPLLHQCIIIDPSTLCNSKIVLKRINKAYLTFQENQYDAAINWCTASLKAEPNHMPKWCYLLRGAIHDRLGNYRAALDDFDAAIKLDDKFHQAHFNRSVSLLKLGKDELALQAIVVAHGIPSEPTNPAYTRNYALILRRMGRFEEARLVYSTLQPSNAASLADSCTKETNIDSEPLTEKQHTGGSLFDALFCQSKDEKAAYQSAPQCRTPDMIDLIVSRLYEFDFFARCPDTVLRSVAQALVYVVVRNGETFYLAHEQSHAFYICIKGTLSVHANLTLAGQEVDTMAASSTHRLRPGDVFGCVGASISSLMMYLADERTEIMYLTPIQFKETFEPQWLIEQHSRFSVFRRSPVFRILTDSELGHITSHSILVRFHKGDILVQQDEYPKRLYILYKGICRFEQNFTLHSDTNRSELDPLDSPHHTEETTEAVRPYHHLLEIPNWPLDFRTRIEKPNANELEEVEAMQSVNQPSHGPLPTIIYDIYPPALVGESAYKPIPEKSKCSIVATTLVEALAVDMHQLKSLSLSKELFAAIISNAPLYVDAAKAQTIQKQHNEWASVRGKASLLLNKARWPVHKERLRHLPNGGSIVVLDEKMHDPFK